MGRQHTACLKAYNVISMSFQSLKFHPFSQSILNFQFLSELSAQLFLMFLNLLVNFESKEHCQRTSKHVDDSLHYCHSNGPLL